MSNPPRLEVEDEDERQRRLQFMFESMNSSSVKTQAHTERSFDFGERKTFAVEPPKELLSRIQAFLPQMAASNALLAQQVAADPGSVDIENIQDTDAQVIEMNLGLGVFEDRSKRTAGDSDSEDSDASMSDSDSSDSSDDSDSSCSSTEIVTSSVIKRPIRPLPKRMRPGIVVLGSSTA